MNRNNYNPCKHWVVKPTMHGLKCYGCMHPDRGMLDSNWFSRLLTKLIPNRFFDCAAAWTYEEYCPLYEGKTPIMPEKRGKK